MLTNITMRELIDTQWNVNLTGEQALLLDNVELIDTQWNVNEITLENKDITILN